MNKNWIKPVAAVAIVVALFLGAGFRIGHPVSGLSTALGSAKSSLAVYKPSGQSTVGSKVVVEVKGLGTAIGVIMRWLTCRSPTWPTCTCRGA